MWMLPEKCYVLTDYTSLVDWTGEVLSYRKIQRCGARSAADDFCKRAVFSRAFLHSLFLNTNSIKRHLLKQYLFVFRFRILISAFISRFNFTVAGKLSPRRTVKSPR